MVDVLFDVVSATMTIDFSDFLSKASRKSGTSLQYARYYFKENNIFEDIFAKLDGSFLGNMLLGNIPKHISHPCKARSVLR